jgi:hypothetical protein
LSGAGSDGDGGLLWAKTMVVVPSVVASRATAMAAEKRVALI